MGLLFLFMFLSSVSFGQEDYNKGYDLYNAKKYELAIDYFNQSIAKDSLNSRLYIIRGASYKCLKLYELAVKDYEKAIVIDDNLLGYNNRAFCYMVFKKYQLALQDYVIVESRIQEMTYYGFNDLGDIYHNIGICKMNLGLEYCDDFKKACSFGYNPSCSFYKKNCQ